MAKQKDKRGNPQIRAQKKHTTKVERPFLKDIPIKPKAPDKSRRAGWVTTIEECKKALTDSHGLVAIAARRLGITSTALHKRIHDYHELQETLKEAREMFVDTCEASLHRAVVNGEGWAVCFGLKCLGKQRGYVERHEITGSDGTPITVTVQWGDKPDAEDQDQAATIA